MKNLKKELIKYLEQNGKFDDISYREIYEAFPFDGNNLSNKQKGDRVRSIWKRMKRERTNPFKIDSSRCGELKYNPDDYQWITTTSEKEVNFPTSLGHVNHFRKDNVPEVVMEKVKQPKILIYDLETSPLKSYVWSLWKQNVNPTNGQLQSQKMILSWSAKWLYEDEMLFDHMFPSEIEKEDDSSVAKSLWKLIDEADIVIAHNAKGFDVKIMNTRFLLHGLNPPRHYQVIDTLLHARKQFKLESNKLDYIAQVLGVGKKHDTGGFQLWVDCMNGSTIAMSKMVDYCNQDVRILEEVYLAMRAWIKPHPPVNLIAENTDELSCPTCSSNDVTEYGTYTTYANIYPAHQCNSCKSTFRSRKANKIDKTNLTISTPN